MIHTLCTSSYEGVVCHYIWLAALSVHLTEQVQSQFPPASLLTCADQTAVGYHIALTAPPYLHHACNISGYAEWVDDVVCSMIAMATNW